MTPAARRTAHLRALAPDATHGLSELERDAVDACARLIRFDTSNYGGGEAEGERDAAEWIAEELRAAGHEPVVVASAPRRANVVVRIPGRDRDRPALLVHGHLDVVPADAADWSVDPFGGEVHDGAVWGRGALDMKGDVAATLAVARHLARTGTPPSRDLVLAFVADEEDGGTFGARHLVDHRAELFAGVGHAVGEGGGRRHRLPDGAHVYPIACAERGTAWIELTARGAAGHGSRPTDDNPVTAVAEAVARLAAIRWPIRVVPQVQRLLDGLAAHLGETLDPEDPELTARLGELAAVVVPTLRTSLSPTVLEGGHTANVIPGRARAVVDGRILPGHEDEFSDAFAAALPDRVAHRLLNDAPAIATDPDDPEIEAIRAAVRAHDPGALVLPCCAGGGTDNKWFHRLGIACFGFAPEAMAAGFHPDDLIHGVDEHVPIESLAFGARVMFDYVSARG